MLSGISLSQSRDVTNLNAIDDLIDESLTPLENKLLLLGKNDFYNLITDGESKQHLYLIESIKRKFNNYKILVNEDSDSTDYLITIRNPKLEIKYNRLFTDKLLGTKKVAREVLVSYDLELTDKKKSSELIRKNFYRSLKDSFDLEKLAYMEDNRYPFTRSVLPEESSLNKLLFPAIIIAASVAATVLFFIIRSK